MESFADRHTPRLVRRSGLEILFDGPHDQARWDVRWQHDDVDVEPFEYRRDVTPDTGDTKTSPPLDAGPQERYVMLTVRRGRRPAPFHLGHDPRQGDVASVAIHRPHRQEAVARLGRLGWHPQTESAP